MRQTFLLACGDGWVLGIHSVLHVSAVSFYNPVPTLNGVVAPPTPVLYWAKRTDTMSAMLRHQHACNRRSPEQGRDHHSAP
jgi:hypothetical protein